MLFSHYVGFDPFPCPSLSPRVCSDSESIESMMLTKQLIFCCPLLLLPSVFPSIGVFCSELALHIKRPKYMELHPYVVPDSICLSKLMSIFFLVSWNLYILMMAVLPSALRLTTHSGKSFLGFVCAVLVLYAPIS